VLSKNSTTVSVVISDPELERMNPDERAFRVEVATHFYATSRFSMGQACDFSGLHRLDFQAELAKRGIYLNYTVDDLHEDLATLQSLGV